jgi:hypothetical protein
LPPRLNSDLSAEDEHLGLNPMLRTTNIRLECMYARYARVYFETHKEFMKLLGLLKQGKVDIDGVMDVIKVRLRVAKDKAMPRVTQKVQLESLKRGSRRKVLKTIGDEVRLVDADEQDQQYADEFQKWVEQQKSQLPRDD